MEYPEIVDVNQPSRRQQQAKRKIKLFVKSVTWMGAHLRQKKTIDMRIKKWMKSNHFGFIIVLMT